MALRSIRARLSATRPRQPVTRAGRTRQNQLPCAVTRSAAGAHQNILFRAELLENLIVTLNHCGRIFEESGCDACIVEQLLTDQNREFFVGTA